MYSGYFIILFSNDPIKTGKIVNCNPERITYVYASTFHNFLYNGYESFCVLFNFWGSSPITIGTITHEVNHAANALLYAREVIPDWTNDEAESYLKAWMADEVQTFMQKTGLA